MTAVGSAVSHLPPADLGALTPPVPVKTTPGPGEAAPQSLGVQGMEVSSEEILDPWTLWTAAGFPGGPFRVMVAGEQNMRRLGESQELQL